MGKIRSKDLNILSSRLDFTLSGIKEVTSDLTHMRNDQGWFIKNSFS